MHRLVLRRSSLFVPADQPEKIAKAAASAADSVILDLEDSVAPDRKAAAREETLRALREIDFGGKYVAVRTNSVDTGYCYREIIDIVERAHRRLDGLVIPKVQSVPDVQFVDALLGGVERAVRAERQIEIELVVETAQAVENAYALASCSTRVSSMLFGIGDYAAELGASDDTLRGAEQFSFFAYAKQRLLQAARAAGVDALDTVTIAFRDDETCRQEADLSRRMGFDGKVAIHPRQVEIINAVFAPAPEAIEASRRILERYFQAQRDGLGTVAVDGKMIDVATVRIEQRKLARARMAGMVDGALVDHLLETGALGS